MKLPNAENAVVDIAKLRDYSLNPNHPEGKHKARAFLEKLGMTSADADRLRQILLEAILKVDAIEQEPSLYGRRFIVDLELSWPEGKFILSRSVIRTAWIIRNDED